MEPAGWAVEKQYMAQRPPYRQVYGEDCSIYVLVNPSPALAHAQVRYTAFDERALDMLMGRHAGAADVSADGEDGRQHQQVRHWRDVPNTLLELMHVPAWPA